MAMVMAVAVALVVVVVAVALAVAAVVLAATAGDPICDLIPIHLDVFRGDPNLLKQFLESYRLPLARKISQHESVEGGGSKFGRLSFIAMCYCILHEDNILGAIFSLCKELRMAKSWEEVEETVWGDLNNYSGQKDKFCRGEDLILEGFNLYSAVREKDQMTPIATTAVELVVLPSDSSSGVGASCDSDYEPGGVRRDPPMYSHFD
ncbi:F-box protein [Camellia lanceoleosa]|uniref:F-box protein n=1 Tax=Camellia lanceoleosa TaxID=1840588 RepID=A0ACC0H1L8_9ERIC|nr:F-box protein [Camellia lanceoleosa]